MMIMTTGFYNVHQLRKKAGEGRQMDKGANESAQSSALFNLPVMMMVMLRLMLMLMVIMLMLRLMLMLMVVMLMLALVGAC